MKLYTKLKRNIQYFIKELKIVIRKLWGKHRCDSECPYFGKCNRYYENARCVF